MPASTDFPALLSLLLLCACGGSGGGSTGPDGPGNGTSPTVTSIAILDHAENPVAGPIQASATTRITLCGQPRDAAGNWVPSASVNVSTSNPTAARIDFVSGFGPGVCATVVVGTGGPATITFSHVASGNTVTASITIIPTF